MKVAEIMAKELNTCYPEDTLEHAASLLLAHRDGFLPVVDHDSRVVGVLTPHDVCRGAWRSRKALHQVSVSDCMTSPPFVCDRDDDLEDVLRLFVDQRVKHLPVLNGTGRLAGTLSAVDVARRVLRNEDASLERLRRALESMCAGFDRRKTKRTPGRARRADL